MIVGQQRDAFQGHVAGALDGSFVVLLEQERADASDDDGLHNLANLDFEWAVAIERECHSQIGGRFGLPALRCFYLP